MARNIPGGYRSSSSVGLSTALHSTRYLFQNASVLVADSGPIPCARFRLRGERTSSSSKCGFRTGGGELELTWGDRASSAAPVHDSQYVVRTEVSPGPS